jgi:hypothetical protein
MKKRRRQFAMAHDPARVTAAVLNRPKHMPVIVTIARAVGGAFKATACVKQRGRRGMGNLARCSGMHGGKTPTEAAGNALRGLGESLKGR